MQCWHRPPDQVRMHISAQSVCTTQLPHLQRASLTACGLCCVCYPSHPLLACCAAASTSSPGPVGCAQFWAELQQSQQADDNAQRRWLPGAEAQVAITSALGEELEQLRMRINSSKDKQKENKVMHPGFRELGPVGVVARIAAPIAGRVRRGVGN